jgi:hypothetical protein
MDGGDRHHDVAHGHCVHLGREVVHSRPPVSLREQLSGLWVPQPHVHERHAGERGAETKHRRWQGRAVCEQRVAVGGEAHKDTPGTAHGPSGAHTHQTAQVANALNNVFKQSKATVVVDVFLPQFNAIQLRLSLHDRPSLAQYSIVAVYHHSKSPTRTVPIHLPELQILGLDRQPFQFMQAVIGTIGILACQLQKFLGWEGGPYLK